MSNQKKRNFQIKVFKHIVVVDPKYADETWKVLEHASGLSFEELYKLFNLRPLPTDMMISEDESLAQFLETEVLSVVSDQCDEEDMVDLSRNFPVEFKEYYVQMQAAKTSQAPVPSQVIGVS